MSDYYLGEVRVFPFGILPQGWLRCDGSLLPINGNQALYSLLGITYGGDGKTTFGLPDLRGRAIVNQGMLGSSPYQIGSKGGATTVALTAGQVPMHNHALNVAAVAATKGGPTDNFLANIASTDSTANIKVFATVGAPALVPLAAPSIVDAGAGGGHQNMQPFLSLNFCISNSGLYPTRP